jgi:hypothetical protein
MDDRMWRARRGSGRRIFVAWLPAIAWAGLIFAFSAQPNLRFVPDAGLDFLVMDSIFLQSDGVSTEVSTVQCPGRCWCLAAASLDAFADRAAPTRTAKLAAFQEADDLYGCAEE